MYGLRDSVIPPAFESVIITCYKAASFYFSIVGFKIILDEFILMVSINIYPIQGAILEVACRIMGTTSMYDNYTGIDLLFEALVDGIIDSIQIFLAFTFYKTPTLAPKQLRKAIPKKN